jgi:hypothetical protein
VNERSKKIKTSDARKFAESDLFAMASVPAETRSGWPMYSNVSFLSPNTRFVDVQNRSHRHALVRGVVSPPI